MADRDLVRKDRQSSPASPPRGTNYLLAIAINDYLHCSKLSNAVRDVEAFIELMTTRYHIEPAHVTFIKDSQANKKNIERAFLQLIKTVTPQDNLIVYFSGHGRYDEHFGGNWVPVEAGTSDDDWADYLSNDLVKTYLARIKSFHTFLIADSCFSGAFFAERSKEKNLANRVDTEPSRWGLTSGKKEIVSDGQSGKHSPFATALLDVLTRATEPPSVMQICTLVLEKVVANALQTPMGSALAVPGHQGGQMVLYFREDEEAAWQTAQQANTRLVYSDFCDKYPHGKYIDEALAKLDSTEEKDIWEQVPKNREAPLRRFIRENHTSPYIAEAQRLVEKLQATITPPAVPVVSPTPSIIVPEHMVLVKGGTFRMGEGKDAHIVVLSDFLFSKYPITFDEYDAFCIATRRQMPDDKGLGRGQRPVIFVDWGDAIAFCNWRSIQEGLIPPGYYRDFEWQMNNGYRLPTEAEWEYAAKGGQATQRYEYSGSNDVEEVAWYSGNSKNKLQVIGQKKMNELGLYDLSGNVWEWCWDWYNDSFSKKQYDPKGPDEGFRRVLRGGAWNTHAKVVDRNRETPNTRRNNIGFRLAMSIINL